MFGEVLQAGVGQNPARQVVFKAGLAKTMTAETVNKVCASGLVAVVHAMRAINAGANAVIAAGGMESMSNAPYLLRDARCGYRFGDGTLIDAMIYDGLWDQYFPMTMASQGSKVANELGLTREEQDRFAFASHQRTAATHDAGRFADEIVPVKVATKAKGKVVVDALPRRGQARVPAAAGGARSRVWEHEPSQQFTLDYEAYGAVRDRERTVGARRSRRSGSRRRKFGIDGETAAARARRHDHGGQRAGRERRCGGAHSRRRRLCGATRIRGARHD